MIDLLSVLSTGGSFASYIVMICLFTGFLFGLFYKKKEFASKEFMTGYVYSKSETDERIREAVENTVSSEIFKSKFDNIDEKLDTMQKHSGERHQSIRDSISKLETLVSTLIKNA